MADYRILIVEDSPTMRQLLVFALKRLKKTGVAAVRGGLRLADEARGDAALEGKRFSLGRTGRARKRGG